MKQKTAIDSVMRHGIKARTVVLAFVASLAMTALPASALTLDTAEALAIVAVVSAFIVTVGLAVLGLHFTAKGIAWARKSG